VTTAAWTISGRRTLSVRVRSARATRAAAAGKAGRMYGSSLDRGTEKNTRMTQNQVAKNRSSACAAARARQASAICLTERGAANVHGTKPAMNAATATKAAVAEGIVAGGGLALLRCIGPVGQEEAKCEGDERTGVQILKRALETPTRQIAENSAVDGGVVVARMLGSEGNIGFDAARKEYVDLVEAGIVDPTKVVRIALENAVSVAGVLLLTEATMTEIPEAKKERVPEPELGM